MRPSHLVQLRPQIHFAEFPLSQRQLFQAGSAAFKWHPRKLACVKLRCTALERYASAGDARGHRWRFTVRTSDAN